MAELPIREPEEPPVVASASIAPTANTTKAVEQNIDPWSVSAAVDEQGNTLAFDYEAISRKWATSLIDQPLLDRFERLTGRKPHRWLRRGLFFSHRDFDKILDYYEKGKPFFLYTGRGPSGDSLHIGHSIPFEFTKWLQDVFDVPLVIMLTDDEKFLFKEKLTVDEVLKFSKENARDILAVGFDERKTFIYSDFEYMGGHFYQNCVEFARLVPTNQVRGAFGFDGSTNIGRVFFPSVQCVAAFATTYPHIWGDDPNGSRQKRTAAIPCFIPCAIDQDPYFRLLRDNAHRMRHPSPKPALIHSKFLTALQGPGGKMSSSDPTSAIFMSDSKNDIKKKINKYAFSGGQPSMEEHRRLGGNPDVDVPYQYLTYFLEDDVELKRVYDTYKSGEMLTGEIKQYCIQVMQQYVEGYQSRRKQITDEVLKRYMTPRKLHWEGNKKLKEAKAQEQAQSPSQSQSQSKSTQSSQPQSSATGPTSQPATQLPLNGTPAPAPPPSNSLTGEPNTNPSAKLNPALGLFTNPASTSNSANPTPPFTSALPSAQASAEASAEASGNSTDIETADAEERLKLSQSASYENSERPGLAKLRGKSYGVQGLSGYSGRVGAMIFGEGFEEEDEDEVRQAEGGQGQDGVGGVVGGEDGQGAGPGVDVQRRVMEGLGLRKKTQRQEDEEAEEGKGKGVML